MKSWSARTIRGVAWAALLALHLLLAASFLADRSPGTDAAVTGFPLDDAWIHLVYGKEVANHGLPYYNTGELEAGFTSPVWVLCTGFAEFLNRVAGVPPVATVKALGVLTAAAASLLIFELNLALAVNPLIGFALAALAAAMPLVAFSQLSGMEVGLTAAWLLAAILALERRRHLAAGVLLGLAYLTRPESVVLAPLLVIGIALDLRGSAHRARATGSAALKVLAPLFAAAAAWAVYCLAVNGHLLPNTFYAKFRPVSLVGNFRQILGGIVLELPLTYGLVGGLVYVAGVAELLRRGRGAGLAVIGLPWLFLAAVAASRTMPPWCGTYFYWWRYVLPALPGLYVPVAVGANLFWRLGAGGAPGARWTAGGARTALCALVLVLLLLVPLSRYPQQLAMRKQQFSWNCQNINEVQVAVGRWVNASVPPDAAVCAYDAGAIRYFGNRRTIDLLGLNSHALVFQKSALERFTWDATGLAKFMADRNATHLFIFPTLSARLAANPKFDRLFTAQAAFRSGTYTIAPGQLDLMVAFRRNP